MTVSIKPAQSCRDDFTFTNSAAAVARFPFPFDGDSYMYSVNLEPAAPRAPGSVFEHDFDIDEHYLTEMTERAHVLERDPRRCIVMPHMETAAWDALEMIMERLSHDYPQWFSLARDGESWRWTNRALGIEQTFRFGDASTLPYGPLEYVMRQTQGDMILLDQRDGDLFMDAGVLTSPADWSLAFDLGMSFKQWHAPVPLAHELGVFERALRYLLAVQPGRPVLRLNWALTVNPRLDTSPETFHEWGADRGRVTPGNVGRIMHLRVELQWLARLPRSNALMFSIRTYLCNLEDVTRNPVWARRLYRVLRDLPDAIVEYKGMRSYRAVLLDWLSQFDD